MKNDKKKKKGGCPGGKKEKSSKKRREIDANKTGRWAVQVATIVTID